MGPSVSKTPGMKSDISPMWLTYHMVKWEEIAETESDQRCTVCGKPLNKTEAVTDKEGRAFEGYVCHQDKSVTWVKVG